MERASKRLLRDELLLVALGGARLRQELDRVPLWRGDHVEVRQLVEDFARYVYLPRLKDPSVLIRAVQDDLALLTWEHDSFAYAESFDEPAGRYKGLRVGQALSLSESAPVGLLVKPDVAIRQLEGEQSKEIEGPRPPSHPRPPGPDHGKDKPPPQPLFTRFYAARDLDPTRAGLEAAQLAQEVIAHLAGLARAQVRVTLEIEATVPEGVPERVVRVVTKNCRTLKFTTHEFERD